MRLRIAVSLAEKLDPEYAPVRCVVVVVNAETPAYYNVSLGTYFVLLVVH